MSYSEDYKKRTIEYLQEGHTYKETCKTFSIAENTLNKWRKQYETTGKFTRKSRSYKHKISKEVLEIYLLENPDAYQSEIAEHFSCSTATVCLTLKLYGYKRKKR